MVKHAIAATIMAALLLGGGCRDDLEEGRTLPALDYHAFRCTVEPVLIERCGFGVCHGNAERPFQVIAPGRYRPGIEDATVLLSELTKEESDANFNAALTFVQSE